MENTDAVDKKWGNLQNKSRGEKLTFWAETLQTFQNQCLYHHEESLWSPAESHVTPWYTWPSLIVLQSLSVRVVGTLEGCQCTSANLLPLRQKPWVTNPLLTAGQRVIFMLEEWALLQQQLWKPHSPSTLHSESPFKGHREEVNIVKCSGSKKKPNTS